MKNATRCLLFAVAVCIYRLPDAGAAAHHTVLVGNDFFSPASLTIARGDSVTWTNEAPLSTHTSTSGNPAPACTTSGFWDSGFMDFGNTFTFTFTNLPAGAYPYICTVHCIFGMAGTLTVTNPPNAPPSVSITNPASGAAFAAPANVTLHASASDSDGTVTNVQFFSGGTLLGNVTSAPYAFAVNNLAAGNYHFTAQAVDNGGIRATSAVVNVFVLTNAILAAPTLQANGEFQITVFGIAGQTYATEASSNLQSWTAISTNVAPANEFNVTDFTAPGVLQRFYRTRQDF